MARVGLRRRAGRATETVEAEAVKLAIFFSNTNTNYLQSEILVSVFVFL